MPESLSHWVRRIQNSAMLYGALGTLLRVGANLIVVPLVLLFMSPSEQAIWWVFLALGGFANLADFGFGQVISRVYSYLWAGAEDFDAEGLRPPSANREPNIPRIRDLNVAVRFLYLRLAIGACLLLGLAGSLFLITPIRSLPNQPQAWGLWAAYLGSICYSLATSHWLLASQGTNRVRDLHVAVLWSSLAYFIIVSLMLWARLGLAAMVTASAVRGILLRHLARKAYHRAVPLTQTKPLKPDQVLLKRLWPNAWKFGLQSLGGYCLANGTVLISSHMLSAAMTASVGLTNQVASFIMSLAVLWLAVKWPQLTMLRTQGRHEEMSVLFARRLGFVMVSFAGMATLLLLLGNYLLALKGTSTRLLPTPYLVVLLAGAGLTTFYAQWGMLEMTNNTVPFLKVSLVTAVVMLTLSIVLTRYWGLWGLILGPIAAELSGSAWYVIRRGFLGQPLGVGQLLRAALTGRAHRQGIPTPLLAAAPQSDPARRP